MFLLKTLIPAFAALMALQGVAQAIRAAAVLAASAARLRRLMPLPELLAMLLVVAVLRLLMAGYPVALTLGGVSLAFARRSATRSAPWISAFSARCRSASSA